MDNDWTPRQQRYISFIAEFATSVVFLSGRNVVADALSRPTVSAIDFSAMATAQAADEQLQYYLSSQTTGLRLRPITPGDGSVTLICDTTHGHCRPFVPPFFVAPCSMGSTVCLILASPRRAASLLSGSFGPAWTKTLSHGAASTLLTYGCAAIITTMRHGPHRVLRFDKFFVIDRNGARDHVSINRLKPLNVYNFCVTLLFL